jgi:hypothetical protein
MRVRKNIRVDPPYCVELVSRVAFHTVVLYGLTNRRPRSEPTPGTISSLH